jgi:hypothetical protein
MAPKINSALLDAILALAAVDYVADHLSDIPAPTIRFLNDIWSYGCRPPLVPWQSYTPQEAYSLGWQQALYNSGMPHILENMRLRGVPDTPLRWFHDTVYGAALLAFRLIEAAEYLSLDEELLSDCPSDVIEMTAITDELLDCCGQAVGDVDGFNAYFAEVRACVEETVVDDTAPRWPPFAGITRAEAAEWFKPEV